MIKIENPADCCGCTACASVCAHDAITMQPDALGFMYPHVDTSKCVDCGLCDKVCAFNDHYDTSNNFTVPEAYGARHKEMKEVDASQSGAAFVAISDYILKQGGVVYGCGYIDHFRVAHKRATSKEQRDEFRGSKYVQSDMNDVFRQVKKDLRNGLMVLFTGTPCQTAGLNSYIGKRLRENLILVDVVCHGVPGPKVWSDYIAFLEQKEGATLTYVNFRDKDYGWHSHRETFKFDKGGQKVNYKYLFYNHIMLRKSCNKCHFANTRRPSDITVCDFWGIEKTRPEIGADNKGLSLMLVNTPKGKEIFEAIKDRMNYFPAKLEDCLQPNLMHSTRQHKYRDQFEKDYIEHGFAYVHNKWGEDGWRCKRDNLFKHIKNIIRPFVKPLLPLLRR